MAFCKPVWHNSDTDTGKRFCIPAFRIKRLQYGGIKTMIIKNVRILKNDTLTAPADVMIENGCIKKISDQLDSQDQTDIVDGQGKTLMPGIIDSHIHLSGIENLRQAASYGVTTMLDMMTDDNRLVDSLRNQDGLTDIRSCYRPVISEPGPMLKQALGSVSGFCTTKEDVQHHIDQQIAFGADYIKLVLEIPPLVKDMLSQELVDETVRYAHEKGKLVSVHATTVEAYRRAVKAGVDILNHIPRNEVMPQEIIDEIKAKDLIVIPTLLMQKGMITNMEKIYPDRAGSYDHVSDAVRRMHDAGIRLIFGTDSNMTNKLNFIPHGKAAHTEMDLWSEAGFSAAEIIHAFSDKPAEIFGLSDRGVIAPGKRADLILIDGDPTRDISAMHNIEKVWIKGVCAV